MTNDTTSFQGELVSLLPRLRRFALALARSRDAAEDLLQSTVEKAIRNAGSFDPKRRLDSWLYKIMQNTWLDTRREAAKWSISADHDFDAPGEDGRQVVEAREDLRRAKAAFTKLPEEQRAVLTLVVLDGLSYKEAAEALSVPIGTIMSRLARARAALAAGVRTDSHIETVQESRHE